MDPYRSPAEFPRRPTAPDAAPDPRFAIKRSFDPWRRLALLVALLVALLAALFHLLPRVGGAPLPWSPWVATGLSAALVVAGYGGLLAFFRRRALGLARENNDAVALLAAGRLDEAGARFTDLARRAGNMHSLRSLFLTNLGVVMIRRGEPDRALPHLDAAYGSGWLAKAAMQPNYTVLLNALALAHFTRGDLPAARRWLARAQASLPAVRRGMLTLTEALVAARGGELRRAAADAAAAWTEAEGALPAFQMRALRLVRAFALAEPVAGDDGAQHADEVATLLAGAHPARCGEFDYLARSWPEFRGFLVARKLSA